MTDREFIRAGLAANRKAALLLACLVLLLPEVASAAPQSVADFLALKPKWDQLVGSRFQLEGRVSTGAKTSLKLTNLPLFFESSNELPDLSRKQSDPPIVVQVTATLARDQNRSLFFILSTITVIEDDQTRLAHAMRDLPADDPEKWYELAQETQRRAAFYEDAELAAAALEVIEKGLQREEAQTKKHDLKTYRRLSEKARSLGLPASRVTQLLYRGHYYDFRSESSSMTSAELAGTATALARELPGAEADLVVVDEELRKEWSENSIGLYDESDATTRRMMHRFLYLELMLNAVDEMADSTGKNGLEVADFIEKLIPEYASRAGDYRNRYRQWRLSRVTEFSREQMLALREEFQQLGDEVSAKATLDRWFQNREALLRKRGPNGLVELAAEYEELQENGEKTAIQLLLQADRERPGSDYVRSRLEGYGYKLINGSWKTESEVALFENSPISVAMREGRVVQAMPAAQVRKIHGKPDAATRVLTPGRVIEYWVYDSGSTRLSIRLSRPSGQAVSIVNSVSELPTAVRE